MKVVICIGSSCHLKGSSQVVEKLQALVARHDLNDKVELSGRFCMDNCTKGVSVTVDDKLHSVVPENIAEFFDKNVLSFVNK